MKIYFDMNIYNRVFDDQTQIIRHSEGISKEDYLKLEDEIFDNQSVDEIFDNAKEYWENR